MFPSMSVPFRPAAGGSGGEMRSSSCIGLVAVFAVSTSVVLLSLQVQKRLVSEFMEKVRGLGPVRNRAKKKVRFAADVMEPSSDNEEYRRRRRRFQR